MYRLVLAVSLILIVYSCETSEPGCLDIIAENYDVFAVTECDSCCQYPSVTLSTQFRFDSIELLTFTTRYKYTETDTIAVRDIQLTFSEFSFYEQGSELKIIDTIRNESPRIYDDFVLIEKASKSRVVGKTNFLKVIDSVRVHTGLSPSSLAQLDPYDRVVNDSRFTALYNKMYVDSIDQLFQFRMDLEIGDSIREIEIKELPFTSVGWEISEELKPGNSWSIPIYIDIRKLIDGISSEDSNEMISTTISENLPASIEKR